MEMTDSIPYRCPWCGKDRTFLSLTQLKSHLSEEHAYLGPNSRIKVFKNIPSRPVDRSSRLLQGLNEEGHKLERQLREAKEAEMNNKTQRYKPYQDHSAPSCFVPPSSNPMYVPVLPFHDNHIRNTLESLSEKLGVSRSTQWHSEDMLYKTDNVLSGIETSAELHHAEQSHQAQELMARLTAKEAELRMLHRNFDKLREEKMEAKEAELNFLHRGFDKPREEEKLEVNVNKPENDTKKMVEKSVQFNHECDAGESRLNRRYGRDRYLQTKDMEKGTSDHEDDDSSCWYVYKGKQNSEACSRDESQRLEKVNSQVFQTQNRAVKKLQNKDRQLAKAKVRLDKLERDREILLHLMKDLLSKEHDDNKQLRKELRIKDEELRRLNTEINSAKVNQKELLLETYELYKEADKNLARLKEMLTLKESQLKVASEKLGQSELSNEQLEFERKTKEQQAEEIESVLKETLKNLQDQLRNVHSRLQAETHSKVRLSADVAAVEEQLRQRDKTEDELKREITAKEQELTEAKRSLTSLQSFLDSAARKETAAREELKTFISELIDRVERAERESRTLKKTLTTQQDTVTEQSRQNSRMSNIPVTVYQNLTQSSLSPRFSSARPYDKDLSRQTRTSASCESQKIIPGSEQNERERYQRDISVDQSTPQIYAHQAAVVSGAPQVVEEESTDVRTFVTRNNRAQHTDIRSGNEESKINNQTSNDGSFQRSDKLNNSVSYSRSDTPNDVGSCVRNDRLNNDECYTRTDRPNNERSFARSDQPGNNNSFGKNQDRRPWSPSPRSGIGSPQCGSCKAAETAADGPEVMACGSYSGPASHPTSDRAGVSPSLHVSPAGQMSSVGLGHNPESLGHPQTRTGCAHCLHESPNNSMSDETQMEKNSTYRHNELSYSHQGGSMHQNNLISKCPTRCLSPHKEVCTPQSSNPYREGHHYDGCDSRNNFPSPQAASTPYPKSGPQQRQTKDGHHSVYKQDESSSLPGPHSPVYTGPSASKLSQALYGKSLPYEPTDLDTDYSDYFPLPNNTSYKSDRRNGEENFHMTDYNLPTSRQSGTYLINDRHPAGPLHRLDRLTPYQQKMGFKSMELRPSGVTAADQEYDQYWRKRYPQLERQPLGAGSNRSAGHTSEDMHSVSPYLHRSQGDSLSPKILQPADSQEVDYQVKSSRNPRIYGHQRDMSAKTVRPFDTDSCGLRGVHRRGNHYIGIADSEGEISDSLRDGRYDGNFSDSLQLSLDDDGILWGDVSDDVYGLSPPGSETTGDIRSSLLSGSASVRGGSSSHDHPGTDEDPVTRTRRKSSNTGSLSLLDDVREEEEDSCLPPALTETKNDKSVRDKLMKFLDEPSTNDANGMMKADKQEPSYTSSRQDSYRPYLRKLENEKSYSKSAVRSSNSSKAESQQPMKSDLEERNVSAEPMDDSKHTPGQRPIYNDPVVSFELSTSGYTPVRNSPQPRPQPRKGHAVESYAVADRDLSSVDVSLTGRSADVNRGMDNQRLNSDKSKESVTHKNIIQTDVPQAHRNYNTESIVLTAEDEGKRSLHPTVGDSVVSQHKVCVLNTNEKQLEEGPKTVSDCKDQQQTLDDRPIKTNDSLFLKDTTQRPKYGEASVQQPSDTLPFNSNIKSEVETPNAFGPSEDLDHYETIPLKPAKRMDDSQASTTMSSEDIDHYEAIPLKPARQLNDTQTTTVTTSDDTSRNIISKEESMESDLDSDLENVSSLCNPQEESGTADGKSRLLNKEESTDFDIESDLEKVTSHRSATPGTVSARNRSRRKKESALKRLQHRKMSAGNLKVGPSTGDESSEYLTDSSKSSRIQEEARRRRVALFSIFKYLDSKTLSQVAGVSREWKKVSRHPSLWKRVELKSHRISSKYLSVISQWCTQLQSLTLEGLQGRRRYEDESDEDYRRKTRGCLEPGMEDLLKACQNTLTSLHIIDCGNLLTDKSLWLASCYSRLLIKLKYVSSSDPVTAEVLWALVGGCPGVTSLFIPPLHPCEKPKAFNNKCLVLIGKFYRDLLELGVGGGGIDINGLLPLVQGCQRLQVLEFDHMTELNDDDVTALCRAGLNNLSVLELNGTLATPKAIQVIYKSCRHLKKMVITLSFTDCYDDHKNKNQRKEYTQKTQALQALQSKAGLGHILKIEATPLP